MHPYLISDLAHERLQDSMRQQRYRHVVPRSRRWTARLARKTTPAKTTCADPQAD
ncbi:MAG TPA: hypothetical protein VM307_10140 [Egibacteraceae bacterium]|nr:hypothetical protein [Egibacteraceae bacterium]